MTEFTRRGALALSAAGVAAAALRGGEAWAQAARAIPVAAATPPRLPIESGATLRIIRPARFVEPDEVIFRANAEKFAQEMKVPVRVDFVSWEDLRAQIAVTANTGTGPDVVLSWNEDPQVYAEKTIELSDVGEYLGQKYGGWLNIARKYGTKHNSNTWLGIPFGGSTGPIVYRKSAIEEAGFQAIPNDMGQFLRLCQALKRINKPAGFALGNAVGDGNGFANFMLWSHGGVLVDEAGRVALNSPETLESLAYGKQLYESFVPGTLSWLDANNNRAFAAQECFLTSNGVSLYFALKNDEKTRAVADDTFHFPLPTGRSATPPMSATTMNAMVFRHTRFPNAAKAFITYMLESEQYDRWLTGCLGYWSHPLAAYSNSAVWASDPKLEPFKQGMDNAYWSGFKGPVTAASGTVAAEYIMIQMYASVASGQQTPAEAVRDAERRARRIYR